MAKLFGLADCNNFFVSCERVLRPDLRNRPVVVLSSNDGCIVSRSNEAKALGVPMGAPYFKVQDFLARKNVTVFSGNMKLYKAVSRRVMVCLSLYSDRIEQYSVDEAFFNLDIASVTDPQEYCRVIRAKILKYCGVPVSIGISTTKTLCKLASETAKAETRKNPASDGVCRLTPDSAKTLYPDLLLEDIWGLGRHSVQKLREHGITNASQLLRMDEKWIKKFLTIRGVMTVRELRGEPCFPLSEQEEKQQSVQVSHSFGQRLTEYDDIRAAVAEHAAEGAFSLRQQGLCAGVIGCYLRTSRFIEDSYAQKHEIRLTPPTSRDGDIIPAALACLEKIFVPGYQYAKAGIYLNDLSDGDVRQMDIFRDNDPKQNRQEKLMKALDALNLRFGANTIAPAMLKCAATAAPRHIMRSNWDPKVLDTILPPIPAHDGARVRRYKAFNHGTDAP